MKKKILPLLVVGILVLGGLGAVALSTEQTENYETIEIESSIVFSGQPVVQMDDDYLRVSFEEANSWLLEDGKPELPIYIKNFELPWGAKNIRVVCTPKEIKSMDISGEIIPAKAVIRGYDATVDVTLDKDEEIYGSSELYPDSWYSYRVGRGLNNQDAHVVFVDIICNIVRYSPANNKLEYLSGVDITVTYDDTGTTYYDPDLYDMVIIAPKKFKTELQPLIEHKNKYGVKTKLETVESILDGYVGYDAPEKIKYFIKYAMENWGIDYVLLVGGLKSYFWALDKDDSSQGTRFWNVPVRYVNIRQTHEVACISDLYYGDIYDDEGNFCSWDSNGDGIYGKPPWDKMDLYPDVYVSRLPCRRSWEVRKMVKKIKNYESTTPNSKSWYGTMVGIGGKTFDLYMGQPDGEYVCDTSISYMGGIVDNPVRLYASNRDSGGPCPVPEDIAKAMNDGAGYVDFQGHGNPVRWDTIWHDGSYPKDWCGGTELKNFWKYFNGKKLPVVVVGGCHNALFNVTYIRSIRSKDLGGDHWYWTHGSDAPVCFSWGLCIVPWGGAIASTGCTGYGMGYEGMPISLSSEMETNFFYQIGQNGATTLGSAHSGSIRKFILENSIGQTEAFCITDWQIFGDPSLKLGGYE